MGRRKNSRNKGYFFRKGRGWQAKPDGETFVPLEYPNGDRMRDHDTPEADVKAAYHRLMADGKPADGKATVAEVCTAYLATIDSPSTFETRANSLFDFCSGFPPRFRDKEKRKREPTAADKIHKGYGKLSAHKLTWLDVDRWLQAHPSWNGSKRTHIQALKRALHYGVERKMLDANPIEGYPADQPVGRVTYITPDQEKALLEHATDVFAVALKVCIRTGARHGCEFAALTSKHVTDHGNRMDWTFTPEEGKTDKLRIIRIKEPEIIELVRERMNRKGPIFRNSQGGVWTRQNLALNFRRTKERTGLEFDDDACMYSCRHTFAKRTLQGYWTGKTINIETLAEVMGNTPEVCRKYYLQWCEHYSEPLWDAV